MYPWMFLVLFVSNANRGWVFYSTDPKYVVHIQFTQLDVELSATGCDFDYIEVFDSKYTFVLPRQVKNQWNVLFQ